MDQPLPYVLLDKKVGETPLDRVEFWRSTQSDLGDTPLAYAGRLDPMASGKLLILIGEECKVQEKYHSLDKTYLFSVVFGIRSDSADVLGLIEEKGHPIVSEENLMEIAAALTGKIALTYPVFSARTVKGKPLHTWALEGRLAEIIIPTKESEIYSLTLTEYRTITRQEIYTEASAKIESLAKVTDPRKALGNDFRRPEVRKTWTTFNNTGTPGDSFSLATFCCTCSSGTYMRALAEKIAAEADTFALAFSIHREEIGRFDKATDAWLLRF